MKIELIHPSFLKDKKYSKAWINKEECLTLATLAAYVPEPHEVCITDEVVQPIDFDSPAEVIAITVNSFNAVRAYQVADTFRRQGRTVVLGGVHVTACPAEAAAHADALVLGEGEETFPALLGDLQAGKLQSVYEARPGLPLQGLPKPRYDLLSRRYWPVRVIQTSRGCPYSCDFCSLKFMYGNKVRYYPVERVLEICRESNYATLFFSDDNFYMNKKRSLEIMRGLTGMRRHWAAQISINAGDDEEWLARAKESGCCLVQIGLESIFEEGLQSVNKKQNKISRFAEQLARIRESGIAIIGCFLFGFDNEPRDIFERTLEFALENRIDYLNCSVVTPFPGTVLYERLKTQGRLVDDAWWQRPYSWYDLLFTPRGELSKEEIEDGIFRTLKQFYSGKEIWRRLAYRFRFLGGRQLSLYEYLMYVYGQYFEAFYNKDRRQREQSIPVLQTDASPAE